MTVTAPTDVHENNSSKRKPEILKSGAGRSSTSEQSRFRENNDSLRSPESAKCQSGMTRPLTRSEIVFARKGRSQTKAIGCQKCGPIVSFTSKLNRNTYVDSLTSLLCETVQNQTHSADSS
ncbi:hypothetical protein QR680_017687 [Steinernema hermaphroditum]|uniref:Uncharacterized protein n=1 Tax=Steinernema hermaphroditum TaxID=289476 RepID=A0AA39HG42_9BILA|nr:hypothetical protein QR680_017687 [Steinernema hermaphroditum]